LTKFFTATVVTVGLTATGLAGVAAAGEELTAKEFLKKGNAICDAGAKKVAAISTKVFAGYDDESPPPSLDVIASFVEQSVPSFRRTLARLAALDGPAALEKKLDKVLAVYATAIKGAQADPQAFFDEPGELLAKPEHMARRMGIECGDSDGSLG
jgi:hypothetical protein